MAGCNDESRLLQFGWDDRRILCSTNIDDITKVPSWDLIEDAISVAHDDRSVAMLHTHAPGETVSTAALERVLGLADDHGLSYFTFSDFKGGAEARPGLALSFDDAAIDGWYGIKDMLAAHRARVTFFVTRYTNWTDEGKLRLAELAAAGHDVQAHSVNHFDAVKYVSEHGLDAYLADEALPSIDVLIADGFPVTSAAREPLVTLRRGLNPRDRHGARNGEQRTRKADTRLG
jgi:polysaccharide deacetylase